MKSCERNFQSEMYFRTSRSGGKGGQNVNKVSTRVKLNFDVLNSNLLTGEEKEILLHKLKNRIDKNGFLHITSDSERSQFMNKNIAVERFYELMDRAFEKRKYRLKTKRTETSKIKRLTEKKIISQKKSLRNRDYFNDL